MTMIKFLRRLFCKHEMGDSRTWGLNTPKIKATVVEFTCIKCGKLVYE